MNQEEYDKLYGLDSTVTELYFQCWECSQMQSLSVSPEENPDNLGLPLKWTCLACNHENGAVAIDSQDAATMHRLMKLAELCACCSNILSGKGSFGKTRLALTIQSLWIAREIFVEWYKSDVQPKKSETTQADIDEITALIDEAARKLRKVMPTADERNAMVEERLKNKND